MVTQTLNFHHLIDYCYHYCYQGVNGLGFDYPKAEVILIHQSKRLNLLLARGLADLLKATEHSFLQNVERLLARSMLRNGATHDRLLPLLNLLGKMRRVFGLELLAFERCLVKCRNRELSSVETTSESRHYSKFVTERRLLFIHLMSKWGFNSDS